MAGLAEILGEEALAQTRRSCGMALRLREQLLQLAGGQGRIVEHREAPWASVTFAGTRHRLTILFAGAGELEAGKDLLTFLPETEFSIPGQLVADAGVVEVEQRQLPAPRMVVAIELLLVEKA